MLSWLDESKRISVAVIGDLILDEYISGSIDRVSPEAPVLVLKTKDSYLRVGGAANAARNIKLAGADVSIVAPIGEGKDSEKLISSLKQDGILTSCLNTVTGWPMIKKTRFSSSSQQILRVDQETLPHLSNDLSKKMIADLTSLSSDAVLISDYGKGALSGGLLKEFFAVSKKEKNSSCYRP